MGAHCREYANHKPKFNLQQLTKWVQRAQQGRYPISLNLEMYEDGSVSPESYELLKELKAFIRGKGTALTLPAQELAEDPGELAQPRTVGFYRADPAAQPVKLRPNDLTSIVAARAKLDGGVFEGKGMTGQHGVAGFYSDKDQLTFYVDAPAADDYAISIILASPDSQTMEFTCGESVITTPSLGENVEGFTQELASASSRSATPQPRSESDFVSTAGIHREANEEE